MDKAFPCFLLLCLPSCGGCAITYPLVERETSSLVGKTKTLQSRANLLSSDESGQLEIVVGPIRGTQSKVGELPEETEIRFRYMWRHRRWYPIGGLVTTDYAWVTAVPPGADSVNARLALTEFEDVFDRTKYLPKPPSSEE